MYRRVYGMQERRMTVEEMFTPWVRINFSHCQRMSCKISGYPVV